MIDPESRRWIRWLLVLLAVPGLLLFLNDRVRPSRKAILQRVERFEDHVAAAARRFRIDPMLIRAVIAAESKGRPEARSRRGALGLMQIMPETGKEWAGKIGMPGADLTSPGANILVGTAYLRDQLDRFGGDLVLALAAYNAGPGNVNRWIRSGPELPGAEVVKRFGFPETRAYVENVLGFLSTLRSRGAPEEP